MIKNAQSKFIHPVGLNDGVSTSQDFLIVSVEKLVTLECARILMRAPNMSLKAVEIANRLRTRVGGDIISYAREVWGGLLALLEKTSSIFKVERVPKCDKVKLVENSTIYFELLKETERNKATIEHEGDNLSDRIDTSDSSSLSGETFHDEDEEDDDLSIEWPNYFKEHTDEVNIWYQVKATLSHSKRTTHGYQSYSDRDRISPPHVDSNMDGTYSHSSLQQLGQNISSPTQSKTAIKSIQTVQEKPPSKCLHIGNVPTYMSESQLLQDLEQYGEVESLSIVTNTDRHFAFVTFKHLDKAINAKQSMSKIPMWRSSISYAHKESYFNSTSAASSKQDTKKSKNYKNISASNVTPTNTSNSNKARLSKSNSYNQLHVLTSSRDSVDATTHASNISMMSLTDNQKNYLSSSGNRPVNALNIPNSTEEYTSNTMEVPSCLTNSSMRDRFSIMSKDSSFRTTSTSTHSSLSLFSPSTARISLTASQDSNYNPALYPSTPTVDRVYSGRYPISPELSYEHIYDPSYPSSRTLKSSKDTIMSAATSASEFLKLYPVSNSMSDKSNSSASSSVDFSHQNEFYIAPTISQDSIYNMSSSRGSSNSYNGHTSRQSMNFRRPSITTPTTNNSSHIHTNPKSVIDLLCEVGMSPSSSWPVNYQQDYPYCILFTNILKGFHGNYVHLTELLDVARVELRLPLLQLVPLKAFIIAYSDHFQLTGDHVRPVSTLTVSSSAKAASSPQGSVAPIYGSSNIGNRNMNGTSHYSQSTSPVTTSPVNNNHITSYTTTTTTNKQSNMKINPQNPNTRNMLHVPMSSTTTTTTTTASATYTDDTHVHVTDNSNTSLQPSNHRPRYFHSNQTTSTQDLFPTLSFLKGGGSSNANGLRSSPNSINLASNTGTSAAVALCTAYMNKTVQPTYDSKKVVTGTASSSSSTHGANPMLKLPIGNSTVGSFSPMSGTPRPSSSTPSSLSSVSSSSTSYRTPNHSMTSYTSHNHRRTGGMTTSNISGYTSWKDGNNSSSSSNNEEDEYYDDGNHALQYKHLERLIEDEEEEEDEDDSRGSDHKHDNRNKVGKNTI